MSHEAALEAFYEALPQDDPESLYERAPCGYLSTTPDGTIVKVNQTFLTWTGYSRDELVGRRSFSQLLTGGGRIYHDTHYAPLLRMQDRVREIALEVVKVDGERLPVLVNAALERDAGGNPLFVRVALFDATERRSYERELLRAKKRAEESEARARTLARTLQQTLIPPHPPVVPGLVVGDAYRPAGTGEEVGGDFYDVFQVAEEDWVVVLGDVSGKGADAAVVTALARHALRALTVRVDHAAEALVGLNEILLHHETTRFCTVALLRLHRATPSWEVTICLGGHPPPLLLREGLPATTVGAPGTLMGVVESLELHETRLTLTPGSTLLLYTDGVTEGRRGDEMYGERRLSAAAQAGGVEPQAVVNAVLEDVLDFQEGLAHDDIAVVAVGVPREGSPTMSR